MAVGMTDGIGEDIPTLRRLTTTHPVFTSDSIGTGDGTGDISGDLIMDIALDTTTGIAPDITMVFIMAIVTPITITGMREEDIPIVAGEVEEASDLSGDLVGIGSPAVLRH